MIAELLAGYIGVSTAVVERMLKLPCTDVYTDPQYNAWVSSLSVEMLDRTLNNAREIYSADMDGYHQVLAQRYGLSGTRMSAYTLGNWVIGYLQYPDTVTHLPKIHQRLPREAMIELLPSMLSALGGIPKGGAEWQRALAVLSLPMLAQS